MSRASASEMLYLSSISPHGIRDTESCDSPSVATTVGSHIADYRFKALRMGNVILVYEEVNGLETRQVAVGLHRGKLILLCKLVDEYYQVFGYFLYTICVQICVQFIGLIPVMNSGLCCQKCTILFPLLPFCFRGLHEHSLAHFSDVKLFGESSQFLGNTILFESDLFAQAHCLGGSELLG